MFHAVATSLLLAERRNHNAYAARLIRDFFDRVPESTSAAAVLRQEHAKYIEDAFKDSHHPSHHDVVNAVAMHWEGAQQVRI